MKKIDLHIHATLENISSGEQLRRCGAHDMAAHLDELGIEKAVLMSAGETSAQLGDNASNREICRRFPDHFAWMCSLDPVHPETVYERLARCKEQGAIGVGELMMNLRMDDPFMLALFDAAQRLSLPVTIHMSPAVGYSYGLVDDRGLPLLEETLRRFPALKILGHSQVFWLEISSDVPEDHDGRSSYGRGPVLDGGRLPQLFAQYPNLYGDLSANSAGRAIMRDPEFGLRFLETYADRLFFATDMTHADAVLPLGAWLDEQAACGRLSHRAYEAICRGNAQRVFGL